MRFAPRQILCWRAKVVEDGRIGRGKGAGYLTDVSDEEWAFVLAYLLLSREDNQSRQHNLRAIFNAVRYVVKGGNQWRLMANDLSYAEQQAYLSNASPVLRDIATLIVELGMRPEEVYTFRVECVDLAKQQLQVPRGKTRIHRAAGEDRMLKKLERKLSVLFMSSIRQSSNAVSMDFFKLALSGRVGDIPQL